MKRYIWGFPGVGKSGLDVPLLNAVDADSKLFAFKGVTAGDLHGGARTKVFERDETYPQNYLDYVRTVEADVVLVNCHISLLEALGKENVLMVYPSVELVPEYLQRYQGRGDNASFVEHMALDAEGMIRDIEHSGFEQHRIDTPNTYLSDLFKREDFKMKLMTRTELTKHLQRAIDLGVMVATYQAGDNARLVCHEKYGVMKIEDIQASVNYTVERAEDAPRLTEAVLDGKFQLDIDQLEKACLQREAELKKYREKLISHFQRAIVLNVLGTDSRNNAIICQLSFAQDGKYDAGIHDAYDLAEDVMNGKYKVNIDNLLDVCKQRELQIEEMKLADRRGGLSREELADKIMQGIVNGALGIEYDQIAPYSHGYEVTFGGKGPIGSTRDFKNRWEIYGCDFFAVPARIVEMIENEKQDSRVFGKDVRLLNIREMLDAIDVMEANKIQGFVPEKDAPWERSNYPYRLGHVATVMDVHAGIGLDGIIQHHYHGTYSTMTPVKQNTLVETLVCMKGFCLDCIDMLDVGPDGRQKVIDYLKKHGTDISTPEKMRAWIRKYPEHCGREQNRVVKQLETEIYARAFSDLAKLKEMASHHSGSLEEFCDKHELLGDWHENVFECAFGVLDIKLFENEDGTVSVADVFGIWDNVHDILEEDLTVNSLKEKCERNGFDIKELDTVDDHKRFGLKPETYQSFLDRGFDDEDIKGIVNDWGVDDIERGYTTFRVSGSDVVVEGALLVEAISEIGRYEDDFDACRQAEKDGVAFINDVDGLEKGCYIDTPENRALCVGMLKEHPEYRIENWLDADSDFGQKYVALFGNPIKEKAAGLDAAIQVAKEQKKEQEPAVREPEKER